MRAVTVQPHTTGSAKVEDVPDPDEQLGSILVEAVATGVCGTDREITSGAYGWAPPGRDRLVLGHESLGRVLDPGTSGMQQGRPRRRHRAAPRPRAVPELRRR